MRLSKHHPAFACAPRRIQTGALAIFVMKSRLDSILDGQWEALAKEAKYKSESLAALCEVSLRQLERFLKYQLGQTPSAWLLDLRLRHAQALLRQGYYTQDIAKDLDFADAPHFCHAFKKVHGRPPQTFRPLDPPDVARRQ